MWGDQAGDKGGRYKVWQSLASMALFDLGSATRCCYDAVKVLSFLQ